MSGLKNSPTMLSSSRGGRRYEWKPPSTTKFGKGRNPHERIGEPMVSGAFVLPCIECRPRAILKLKIAENRISTTGLVWVISSLGKSVKPRPIFIFLFFIE